MIMLFLAHPSFSQEFGEDKAYGVLEPDGFSSSIGFGEYHISHPQKFFSTLSGYNHIEVPQYYTTEQMLIGNTLKLGKKLYFLSGILYGSQMGIMGNNWGMGTREGLIWRINDGVSIVLWSQYYSSVNVYMPVMFYMPDRGTAALEMPATPEVFSFGVQASFPVGEFIFGVGTSISPVPFQNRRHTKFRYR